MVTKEREVATELWPQHAEMLSEKDWATFSEAIDSNDPFVEQRMVEPIGEAKDAILASLMIVYYTMKIASIAIEVGKEISGLKGKEKVQAIITGVTKRLDEKTPSLVRDKITQIVEALN